MKKLIPTSTTRENGELFTLYKAVPFKPFHGDCSSCSSYKDGPGMTEGGQCKKHNTWCGWGFVCKDHQFRGSGVEFI